MRRCSPRSCRKSRREYRITKDRNARAIAGLSMGGKESLLTGLNNLDKFSWIGAFSSAGASQRGLSKRFSLTRCKSESATSPIVDRLWYRGRSDHGKPQSAGLAQNQGSERDRDRNARHAYLDGMAKESRRIRATAFPLDEIVLTKQPTARSPTPDPPTLHASPPPCALTYPTQISCLPAHASAS